MTSAKPPVFANADAAAIDLHVLDQDTCEDWLAAAPAMTANWARTNGFRGAIGQVVVVPAPDGQPAQVLVDMAGLQTGHANGSIWRQPCHPFPKAYIAWPRVSQRRIAQPNRLAGYWRNTAMTATNPAVMPTRIWSPPKA